MKQLLLNFLSPMVTVLLPNLSKIFMDNLRITQRPSFRFRDCHREGLPQSWQFY